MLDELAGLSTLTRAPSSTYYQREAEREKERYVRGRERERETSPLRLSMVDRPNLEGPRPSFLLRFPASGLCRPEAPRLGRRAQVSRMYILINNKRILRIDIFRVLCKLLMSYRCVCMVPHVWFGATRMPRTGASSSTLQATCCCDYMYATTVYASPCLPASPFSFPTYICTLQYLPRHLCFLGSPPAAPAASGQL